MGTIKKRHLAGGWSEKLRTMHHAGSAVHLSFKEWMESFPLFAMESQSVSESTHRWVKAGGEEGPRSLQMSYIFCMHIAPSTLGRGLGWDSLSHNVARKDHQILPNIHQRPANTLHVRDPVIFSQAQTFQFKHAARCPAISLPRPRPHIGK